MDTSKLEEKAKLNVEKRNYDYAIVLYMQILTVSPKNLDVRKSLHAVRARRAKENGSGLGGKLTGWLKSKTIPSKGDPDKRMKKCEEILNGDPDNQTAKISLGHASFDGNYHEVAVWIFEDLWKSNPTDVKVMRILQDIYNRTDQNEKALEVNQAILKVAPGDREASQAVKDISARAMSSKFENAKSSRDITKDVAKDERMDLQERGLRTVEDVRKMIGFTEEDIQSRPGDPNVRVKLGDLHQRLKNWDDAKATYEKAQELSPTEYRFQMKLDDVQIGRMEQQYNQLAAKAKAGDASAKEQAKKVYGEYMAFQLKSYEAREQQYITDQAIAFKLGGIYFQFKKYDEALKRFQKTVKDPQRRAVSALRLGQCFGEKGQYDLAIRQLTDGIDSIEIMNDQKKELLYTRGIMCETKGDAQNARKDFMTIYEIDIAYKDVSKKIEG